MVVSNLPKPINYDSNKEKTLENKCGMMKFLYAHFPILTWLPTYSFHYLQCDIIAGVTVGLMVLPQALAYSSIARLSSESGLYSAYVGGFVYCIFGTSKDNTIGPTAILSLLVQTYNIPHCDKLAVLSTFYVGLILFAMGILKLGFLVRFVSVPVISGFTSAAAITISMGQLKNLVGVEHTPRDLFGNLIRLFKNIKDWNWYDFLYGVLCIVIILLMRKLTKLEYNKSMSFTRIICYKLLWFCGTARNALIVIVSGIIMRILEFKENNVFNVISDIQPGLPGLSPPLIKSVTCGNKTLTFKETLNVMGSGLILMPMLAFIGTMAIGKAFSRANHYKIIPSQELIALGISNIMNSFVSGLPVCGSFSRSAVNSQSGVKTPLGGLFTGIMVMIATQFLTRWFKYIPKACLGAIIISSLLMMIDYKIVKSLWKIKKIDIIPFVITFLGCFYSLDYGLLFGIGSSLVMLLYPIVIPNLKKELKEITVLRIKDNLSYVSIEHVISKIEDVLCQPNPPIVVILDMIGVNDMDYSVIIELRQLVQRMEIHYPDIELLMKNVCVKVRKTLTKADLQHIVTTSQNISERFEESARLLQD